jgi:hypothetical protein
MINYVNNKIIIFEKSIDRPPWVVYYNLIGYDNNHRSYIPRREPQAMTENTRPSRAGASLFLPKVLPKHYSHYRENIHSRAKKKKRELHYVDSVIETQHEKIYDIVAKIEERERFRCLRETVAKVIGAKGKGQDVSARFIIEAQNCNDCCLAVLYINHHLRSASYDGGFTCNYYDTYKYHSEWKDSHNNTEFYDGESYSALPIPSPDKDEKLSETPAPVWYGGAYPVYVNLEDGNIQQHIDDDSFLEKFSVMYALESREPRSKPSLGGFGMGFGGFSSEPTSSSNRNPKDALLLEGFKHIYIPDAAGDELQDLFSKISRQMGLKLAGTVKFDTLLEQYESYFSTEYDLRGIAKAIKEAKVLDGRASSPVTYKDFVSVFDSASELRKKYAATKKSKKIDKNPWDELNSMAGNAELKREVRKMVDLLLLEKRRKEHGLPSTQLTRHAVFAGNLGSAKTTCARLIARILQHEGIIKGNNFRECVKSDIVGQYVGWTAAAVDGIFKGMSQNGGDVLFLDEAYTYTEKDSTCFDKEAVNCITQNMENYRDVMCIFAGYEQPMKQFIEANPGLRSRIGFTFCFSDYNAGEMYRIAEYQAKVLGFALPAGCEQMVTDYFSELIRLQGEAFGNGREARKLIEGTALELVGRLSRQRRKATKTECRRLTVGDLESAIRNSLGRERSFGGERKRTIGFCG